MNHKKRKIILIVFTFILVFIVYCYFENNTIEINNINIIDNKIPEDFNNFKIAHISDFHNCKFKNNNQDLINMINEICPEVIFITGDIIDKNRTDIEIASDFIEKLIKIAPIYYVSGNHESATKEYYTLYNIMKKIGVIILDNTYIELSINDSIINIVGLADPNFVNSKKEDYEIFSYYLNNMDYDLNNYTILLSHRPELFNFYTKNNIDLVFSGHAHGGQFRLPLIGGIIAPNQGLFPDYTSGVYTNNTTQMIVSRGLGNSIIPIRINNNPEIIIVTLNSK